MSGQRYTIESVGAKLEQFLRQVIQNAHFELDFTMAEQEHSDSEFETPELTVRFTGADVDLLLANRAELLLALELVSMEALRMPSEDHSRISFDANDYRALRVEELRLSALAAAERVIRTGQLFRFNPMNSRERRVIHLALRGETGVRSESLGSGPQRQVVIYPAGMASLPEPPPSSFSGPRTGPRPERRNDRGNDRRGDRRPARSRR